MLNFDLKFVFVVKRKRFCTFKTKIKLYCLETQQTFHILCSNNFSLEGWTVQKEHSSCKRKIVRFFVYFDTLDCPGANRKVPLARARLPIPLYFWQQSQWSALA